MKVPAAEIKKLSVFVGMPVHRDMHVLTVQSLLASADAMAARGIKYEILLNYGNSVAEAARSSVSHKFLQSEANRLFWIDSDQVWKPEDFISILALSTKLECVGTTYPAKLEPITYMINAEDGTGLNEFNCLEVNGMGLGFTCVHRKVIEQLAEKAPKLVFPDSDGPIPHMFRNTQDNGAFQGEDMAFFSDVRKLGYKVNLFPFIDVGHVGSKNYQGSLSSCLMVGEKTYEVPSAPRSEAVVGQAA